MRFDYTFLTSTQERATFFPCVLFFLKLGGSLITDKTRPYTPRLEKLDSLALPRWLRFYRKIRICILFSAMALVPLGMLPLIDTPPAWVSPRLKTGVVLPRSGTRHQL